MATLLFDLKFAVRSLARAPGFTAAVVLTLALGIGANAAIYSVVRGVLLEPLPFERPEQIVTVWEDLRQPGLERSTVSPPEFADLAARATGRGGALEQAAVHVGVNRNVSGVCAANGGAGCDPERLQGAAVTAGFWPTLGVRPLLGRVFAADEDRPGARVVVLSHALWRRRFAADPALVGRTVVLNLEPHLVLGVMPPGFRFPGAGPESAAEFWIPMGFEPADLAEEQRGSHFLSMIGRLRPGVTPAMAQGALTAAARAMAREHPATYVTPEIGTTVVTLAESLTAGARAPLLLLFGAVAMVLLVACANVANLVLVRAAGRRREIALRSALGATAWRIVRQLLAESLVLAAAAGALGALVALWARRALVALGPAELPRLDEVRVDGAVLAFTAAVALGSTVLAGLAPSGAVIGRGPARPDRGFGLTSRGARAPAYGPLLVALEAALALVLLAGAALLGRSFARLTSVDAGFDAERLLTLRVALPGSRYTPAAAADFYARLLDRVRALPGVQGAEAAAVLPLAGGGWDVSFTPLSAGGPHAPDNPSTEYRPVSPGFLGAMGVPLLAGRAFDARDDGDRAAGAPLAAVVNEAFVRRYVDGGRPAAALGRRARLPLLGVRDTVHVREIVGVVGDVRGGSLDARPVPEMYVPMAQQPQHAMILVVRARPAAGRAAVLALAGPVRDAVRALDPAQPVYGVRTMDELLSRSLSQRRFQLWLLGAFAGAALLLAALGVYAVVSHAVAQRAHEIGVRVALGAGRADVMRLVLGRGMAPVAVGLAAGLLGALALTRLLPHLLGRLLYETSPTDPAALAAAALLLAGAALAATWLPSRRATRVDPTAVLRGE
ncbi:MAG TPA: ABC transporter permease [Gemmatimonadaceae bacterium]|nr:ABC transporter permease [Gemmatimonadaceae bacterium]